MDVPSIYIYICTEPICNHSGADCVACNSDAGPAVRGGFRGGGGEGGKMLTALKIFKKEKGEKCLK